MSFTVESLQTAGEHVIKDKLGKRLLFPHSGDMPSESATPHLSAVTPHVTALESL